MEHRKPRSRLTLEPAKRPVSGHVVELSGLSDARRAGATARQPQPRQPQQGLAARLADLDRSLNQTPATTRVAAKQPAQPEHDNVRFAREAIARMAATAAAGTSTDDCVACSMLDAREACQPPATLAATSSTPLAPKRAPDKPVAAKAKTARPAQSSKKPLASTKPAARKAAAAGVAPRRPRPAKAFSVGFAGGAVIAVVAGMFGTAMLMEPQIVTAAPHHAIPSSVVFAFSLASAGDIHDGGPAWAWREAVTLRTIRDITIQRADTGSSWATRAQLASLSRAGAAYPVMQPTLAKQPLSAQPLIAALDRQPHHLLSVEALGKLETAALRAIYGTPPMIAVASALQSIEAHNTAPLAAQPAPAPAARTPKKTTPASGRPASVVHHATPRSDRGSDRGPDRAAATVTDPSTTAPTVPRVHTAHHVLTKATPTSQRPLKLIATRKPFASSDDDHDGDTASVSAPANKDSAARAAEPRVNVPKKAMLLGAGSTAATPDKPQQNAEVPKTRWWKSPMPGWAPFKSSDNN